MPNLDQREVMERAAKIKLLIFDVDGVLTSGALYLDDRGDEYKAFYSRDGLGMRLLQDSGVELAVITGRTSGVVTYRMESLDIKHVFQGRTDKVPAFEELRQNLNLQTEEIAYVGDDIIDLPVMRRVGLSAAPADAHPLVLRYAHWQTPHDGGKGAARDVCELIMQAQGNWQAQLARFGIDDSAT